MAIINGYQNFPGKVPFVSEDGKKIAFKWPWLHYSAI
jgi:hypothetical protein